MKKTLLFCALVMAVMTSCNQPETKSTPKAEAARPEVKIDETQKLPIAVVNIDTLLNNYDLALIANESLLKKQEDTRLDLSQRARSLQNEMVDFQKKLENQAFLSRERAENEQRRLVRKQEELQQYEQQKSEELMIEQQNLSLQMRDSINSAINAVNANGQYHLILSTSTLNDNVLFAAQAYNITYEVLDILNDRYNASKK